MFIGGGKVGCSERSEIMGLNRGVLKIICVTTAELRKGDNYNARTSHPTGNSII